MKRRETLKTAVAGLVFLFVLALVSSVHISKADPDNQSSLEGSFVPNEILVGLKPHAAQLFGAQSQSSATATGIESLDKLNDTFNVLEVSMVFSNIDQSDRLAEQTGLVGIIRLRVPSGTDIFEMMPMYRSDAAVDFVEPNRIYRALSIPNDSDFYRQWALNNIGQTGGQPDADIDAPEAWDIETGNSSVMIAVVDTGVDYSHTDLAGGRVRTDIDRDFINGDEDAMDDHGHGTFVSGLAAANTNNDTGIAGICPGCQILPVKVLDSEGAGSAVEVAQGIQYAAQAGAQILNLSLGFPSNCGCSETVARAINYAYETGVFLVAASGNDEDKHFISYPAASSRVFSVGASNHLDGEADFSNRSLDLDIVAPGEEIYSLKLNNGYDTGSGTSAAAPHVSGVAGLVLSNKPDLRNDQLGPILYQSADDFSISASLQEARPENTEDVRLLDAAYQVFLPFNLKQRSAFGRLNAYRAVTLQSSGSLPLQVDTCEGEPTCAPGCLAEISLAGNESFFDHLDLLYSLRENVLESSNVGKSWIDLYEANRVELATKLAFDKELREQTIETFVEWRPLIEVLVDSEVDTAALISESQLLGAEELLDRYSTNASDRLQNSIDLAKEVIKEGRNFIGRDTREAWQYLND